MFTFRILKLINICRQKIKSDNLWHFQHHQREKPLNPLWIKGIKSEMLKMCVSLWETCQIHCQAQQCIPDMARLLRTRTSIKLSYTANSDLINTCCIRIIISVINININILTKYWIIQAHCWPRVILEPHIWMMSITLFIIFIIINMTLMSKISFKVITIILCCNNH